MAFLALLIGVVLLVAAIRNTHGELLSAIETDAPAFAIWAAAIFAVAVIGFIPGLKPVSRGLLALVVVVLVLTNYKEILSGFQGAWQGAAKQGAQGAAAASSASSGSSGGPDAGSITSTILSALNAVNGDSGTVTMQGANG